jgi:ATP-dependent Clp protease ATP-binding subunit ClpC
MIFDFYNTTIYQAVKIARSFPDKLVKLVNWLLFIVTFSLLMAFFGDKPLFGLSSSIQVLGLFLIVLSFDILGWIWLLFFKSALKSNIFLRPPLDQMATLLDIGDINLAEYLDFDLAYALRDALNFCKKKGIPLDPIHLIFFLWENERIERVFEKLGLKRKNIKDALKKVSKESEHDGALYGQAFITTMEKATHQAIAIFHRQIEVRDFLVAAAEYSKNFRDILFDNDLEISDVDHVISWDDFITYEAEWKRKFWKLDNLLKKPGIGKQWAAGYTVNVDKYAADVTRLIKQKDLPLHVVGRRKEIEAIERVLSRRGENNVLVIGKPGGGRSTIVYSFAKRVLEGRSAPPLNYKRVLELDMQSMLAGLRTPGEILDRFRIVFSEAENAGNIILIIDDIHNYIGRQEGVGGLDISSALIPYLGSSNLQIIGITTFEGFHKNIEPNPAITNFFENIEVEEPLKEEALFILEDLLPGFEKQYNLKVGYKALRDIVDLTDRYVQNAPFPEKAIDYLGEVMVYTKTKTKSKVVLSEHVAQIISQRTKIPAGEIQKTEKEKLINLEVFLHQRIIDQNEAVNALADAMRRTRAGVAKAEKPIGTFLFLGPTGVGKTETSKALAESYFGSEKRMIRLDMTEYQTVDSINRLIGSSNGSEQGQLTNAIRDNPFSLILLDEIEKAHHNILNLFLQVLDEGRLTDSLGRTVSFRNSIIIGTSNAGAEFIRKYVENKAGYAYSFFKKELLEHLLSEGIFKPEFLNRFDAVIVFTPLTRDNLIEVAMLMLQRLNKRLNEGKGIQLIVTKELAGKVADLGYHPEFGARPMNRVVQDRIESKIAMKILKEELRRGDVIEIKPEEI